MPTADAPDLGAWGVEPGYWSVDGTWHDAAPEAIAAVLDALGAGHDQDGRPDAAASLPAWVDTSARCPAPPRGWGWAVQLYELQSSASGAIGDLEDVAELGGWSAERGASFLLLNPLHAPLVGLPQEPSPYFASTRLFLNPLYARVPMAVADPPAGALIDHDVAFAHKIAALEAWWSREPCHEQVDAFVAEMEGLGLPVRLYATFCALSEVHGRPWSGWPDDVRTPSAAGVRDAQDAMGPRVRFHCWLQWLLDGQLAGAAAAAPLVVDLAIGTDPAGFDAWRWQELMAEGFRIGAPPDEFNAAGQDWGLPPFDPWKLAASGYSPFVELVRAALRHARGLRIDHVMGLSRLYWIPPGHDGASGVYVRYPVDELLAILATEAARVGAFVVGEDLGTVEDELRHRLTDRGVLSTRLLWFEPEPPERWPEHAMASVTTHDLPTVAGVWTGADGGPEMRDRLVGAVGDPVPDAGAAEVAVAAYRRLAASPCALVAATLEDVLGVADRPNLPGGTDDQSWSRRLPVPVEELVGPGSPLEAAAEALRR